MARPDRQIDSLCTGHVLKLGAQNQMLQSHILSHIPGTRQQWFLHHRPFNLIKSHQTMVGTPLSQENHIWFQHVCPLSHMAGLESLLKLQTNPILAKSL